MGTQTTLIDSWQTRNGPHESGLTSLLIWWFCGYMTKDLVRYMYSSHWWNPHTYVQQPLMKCNSPLSLDKVQPVLYSSLDSSRRNSCPGKIPMIRTWLLFFAFVDLEKVFDCVPRKVLWWAMRKVGVEEWIVHLVQAMYNNARSRVRVGSEYSEEFEVGVHQGSVLSPLLFIIVLEAFFRVGVPWELFFADDLVIIATSLEECVERVKAWKHD